MRIYLASPLFSQAERLWNRTLAAEIVKRLPEAEICLPQEMAAPDAGPEEIYRACIDRLAASDAVVAVLDGADPDSGTCVEIGEASARGIPVIGVRTDFRPGEDRTGNLMATRSCREVVVDTGMDSAPEEVGKKVAAALKRLG